MRRWMRQEEEQGIDISPLIDVVFILLIFFMVSTTFQKDQKLELERPKASTATPVQKDTLKVFVDRDKQIYVDGQKIRPWVLQSKVRELLKKDTDNNVLVITDRGVPAEKLIEVVDQCRLAGAGQVGVAAETEYAL